MYTTEDFLNDCKTLAETREERHAQMKAEREQRKAEREAIREQRKAEHEAKRAEAKPVKAKKGSK